ncbi:hypothetical protein [Paraburkholderia ultramafica]|uniref:hypothetical protein n=1 Tax=Paraburkholderia ultramafica TaxID=1544867 RepID=UPI001583C34F|nr:hypothetical protein [Paraburkholderia ultramafica]
MTFEIAMKDRTRIFRCRAYIDSQGGALQAWVSTMTSSHADGIVDSEDTRLMWAVDHPSYQAGFVPAIMPKHRRCLPCNVKEVYETSQAIFEDAEGVLSKRTSLFFGEIKSVIYKQYNEVGLFVELTGTFDLHAERFLDASLKVQV